MVTNYPTKWPKCIETIWAILKGITCNLKLLWLVFEHFLEKFGVLFISTSGPTVPNVVSFVLAKKNLYLGAKVAFIFAEAATATAAVVVAEAGNGSHPMKCRKEMEH